MNKTNLIALIVTFSLIGVLILTTIIAGFSTKSFMPEFATPNSIAYAYDSGTMQVINAGDSEFNGLKNALEGAFKKSYLTAMFDGSNSRTITATNTVSTAVSQTGTYLRLDYATLQTVRVNGEVFRNNGLDVRYDSVWLTVKNEAGFKSINLYLTNNSNRYLGYVTTIADTQNLFDTIKTLATRHTAN